MYIENMYLKKRYKEITNIYKEKHSFFYMKDTP